MNKRNKSWAAALLIMMLATSCKKWVAVDPPINQLTYDKVFSDSATAVAALSNLYVPFARTGGTIENYFTSYPALYADELYPATAASTTTLEYYNSSLSPANSINAATWRQLYFVVYSANNFIEGLQSSGAVGAATKEQWMAEAIFLRAFAYTLMANTYGNVPLVLTTDVKVSATTPRTPVAAIYSGLATDLQAAAAVLPATYPTAEKTRANKWAAKALLARVYAYAGNWQGAASAAGEVIGAGAYSLPPLSSVFVKNSGEAILQFWARDGYSWAGGFIPASGLPSFAITPGLLAAFEPGDARRAAWTKKAATADVYYPYKYRNRATTTGATAEYTMALRLAEQYLLRAEAEVELGNFGAAADDINAVRARAALPPVAVPLTREEGRSMVQQERRVELFTEWGHRLFDLRRWGKLDEVMSTVKPSWRPAAQWYPVPQTELLNNPALVQNEGY